jgi:hypothetical protein
MKKWIVGCCLVLQVSTGFAASRGELKRKAPPPTREPRIEELEEPQTAARPLIERKPRFELSAGINVTSFDYKEELDAPLKSTEKGTFFIPFVQGKLFFHNLNESYLKFFGEYSGNVVSTYDGSTELGVPVKGTNDHAFFEFETDFYWAVIDNLYLYSGVGFRYWNRFLNGGSGYREIYTWGYLPVGIRLDLPISETFLLGIDVSARMMFGGKIQVIFSETVTNGDDTELTLGNKAGYKIQIPMKYQPSQSNFNYQLTPWYEASQIGASDVRYNATKASLIQEPASKTVQFGAAISAARSF